LLILCFVYTVLAQSLGLDKSRLKQSRQPMHLMRGVWSNSFIVQLLPVIEYRPQISSDFHVLDFRIFMILAVLGLYLVYRFTVNISQKNTTQVFVDLIGSKDNVLVQVLTLPHQSNMYTYKATHFVE
jgi:hypothetical protein